MNRWSAAAVGVTLATIAVIVLMPKAGGCPTAGLNECGGFQLSPLFVGFVGVLVAAALAFVGFVRTTK